jgi:hypothetical protein
VVQELIRGARDKKISRPSPRVFVASKGEAFLRCYKGIQEGSLYLLPSGILFLKPVVFIAMSEIESLSAGRGGSAQTRYVDLKVGGTCPIYSHCASKVTVCARLRQVESESSGEFEFSNIDRDELVGIQVQ